MILTIFNVILMIIGFFLLVGGGKLAYSQYKYGQLDFDKFGVFIIVGGIVMIPTTILGGSPFLTILWICLVGLEFFKIGLYILQENRESKELSSNDPNSRV